MMLTINRTCGTTIGVMLFISLCLSDNGISTVEANCLMDRGASIICSDKADICKTYTLQRGINFSLTGYNTDKIIESGTENIIMNEEKIFNLKKLDQIELLEDGWNGNTAKAFKASFISKVREIITALEVQPEIFPTACNSIQIEYEKEDSSYLEIEISPADTWEVFKINNKGKECFFSIVANVEAIIKVVNSFYE
ncbi:hypothetical protein BN3660_03357 [Eubacteriaceae bacterium CHKCI004]|nr:hypothetical protein BN3660_03357 [Eubacteriaceae bacterium CHKCI004]